MSSLGSEQNTGVAIVGWSGRFPGASGVGEYWRNLVAGVESIRRFSRAEVGTGAEDEVRARGMLDGVDLFDAGFFGVTAREAEVMDPQHRLFLEEAWSAMENAGYDTERYTGAIGLFAGLSLN